MTDQMYADHPLLAIYPNVRGFGYALFPELGVLKEAGIATIPLRDESIYIARILKMIDVYHPTIILIPTPNGKFNRKRERIRALLAQIRIVCKANEIMVKAYSREEIRTCFEDFNAYSKVQIAQKIAKWFPDIADRCPTKREAFMAEDFSQGMFDAISMVVTYYGNTMPSFH